MRDWRRSVPELTFRWVCWLQAQPKAISAPPQRLQKALRPLPLRCQTLASVASVPSQPETEDGDVNITPFWYVKSGSGRAWLDQQNDVTVKDIKLAHQGKLSLSRTS
jgi:hypothetical protein